MARYGKLLVSIAAVSLFALAGCGTTTSDRLVSGGLLGAAGGAAIGAVQGDAAEGAVIGAVLGAAAGALTRPDQVNLGPPAWTVCTRRDQSGRCIEGHY